MKVGGIKVGVDMYVSVVSETFLNYLYLIQPYYVFLMTYVLVNICFNE